MLMSVLSTMVAASIFAPIVPDPTSAVVIMDTTFKLMGNRATSVSHVSRVGQTAAIALSSERKREYYTTR